jgi:glutamine amidotransferase
MGLEVMIQPEVTIIDYGVGNLLSVQRALEYCGAKVTSSSDPRIILSSKKLILPGVGAFPNAMESLKKLNLISILKEIKVLQTPLLAICLGMQLLMDKSDEFGETPGLGLISGRVIAIPDLDLESNPLKIPHIGWGALHPSFEESSWANSILNSSVSGDSVYFTHSFMAQPTNSKNQIAHVAYGGHQIPAVISTNQITGCQFHPEKSGVAGLKILKRFSHD